MDSKQPHSCCLYKLSATGQLFESTLATPPGKAIVYVYRPQAQERCLVGPFFFPRGIFYLQEFWVPDIYMDGLTISSLRRGGFMYVFTDPGEHVFAVGQDAVTLDVRMGEAVFLRVTYPGGNPIFDYTGPRIAPVMGVQAQSEMTTCRET